MAAPTWLLYLLYGQKRARAPKMAACPSRSQWGQPQKTCTFSFRCPFLMDAPFLWMPPPMWFSEQPAAGEETQGALSCLLVFWRGHAGLPTHPPENRTAGEETQFAVLWETRRSCFHGCSSELGAQSYAGLLIRCFNGGSGLKCPSTTGLYTSVLGWIGLSYVW